MTGTHRRRAGRRAVAWPLAALLALAAGTSLAVYLRSDDSSAATAQTRTRQEALHAASRATPSSAASAVGTPSTSVSGADASATSDGASACTTRLTSAERLLAAADSGVSHWREHVEARTALLTGRLPKARVDGIYKRTRLAGPVDLQRFEAASAAYRFGGGGCGSSAGTACRERAARADTAVRAARAVMAQWHEHQHNMAAHRDGEMDTARAQELWVQSWREAPPVLRAYSEARRSLASAPSC